MEYALFGMATILFALAILAIIFFAVGTLIDEFFYLDEKWITFWAATITLVFPVAGYFVGRLVIPG